MESQTAEYNLPPSLETKYVGEMKDGMWVNAVSLSYM